MKFILFHVLIYMVAETSFLPQSRLYLIEENELRGMLLKLSYLRFLIAVRQLNVNVSCRLNDHLQFLICRRLCTEMLRLYDQCKFNISIIFVCGVY